MISSKKALIMKKIVYLVALVAISLLFVQCEQNGMGRASGAHNGHEYVDLGLPSGLKWAICNVGAESPEGYGDYFAWGEVKPKEDYSWKTYKYEIEDNLIKYNGSDGKIVLDVEDDAASVNWGGKWRMPTKEEQDELLNNCAWTWISQNGVNGYKVTGPNGNSIFLPAVGNMDGGRFYDAGLYGAYWSSSLNADSPGIAYNVGFSSGNVGWYGNLLYYGLTVRPVCK